MREMKDSGVEWIGEIPAHWEINRLKSFVLTHFGGCWGDDAKGNENDVLCIRIADFDFSSQTVKESASTMRNYTQAQIEKGLLKDSDLIIEKSGGGDKTPVGRVVVYDKSKFPKAMFANFSECLRPKNIDNKFLAYQLKALYYSVDMHYYFNQTTGLQNLDMQTYLNAMMCFPTMEDQQKIAAHLDRKCTQIDALISNAQQQIEKLKAYKQSVITETVTKGLDPDVQMKDSGVEWIGEIPEGWSLNRMKYISSYNDDSLKENTDSNLEIKYVDISSVNLEDGIIEIESMEFKDAPSRARRIAKKGDIIVSTVRTYLKAIASIDIDGLIVSTGFCVIRPLRTMDKKYVEFWCKSNIFTDEVSRNSYGISYPAINASTLMDFSIVMPPIIIQKQIVEYLSKRCSVIDSLIKLKSQKIEKLQQYKKSLIYEYVTGKKEITA